MALASLSSVSFLNIKPPAMRVEIKGYTKKNTFPLRYRCSSISVSSFMGYLKGKSALMIFDKHANLKYKFGNRKFWSEGYYVSTVGLNEATIRKYIREQEKSDLMQDKLSTREHEDPFKG